MQLSQSVKLKQKQSLVMTPQLQQAIKLLQLSIWRLGSICNSRWMKIRFWNLVKLKIMNWVAEPALEKATVERIATDTK